MILVWIVGIGLALNITWRLFGTRIINFGLKQMVKGIAKQNEEQRQAYARYYADDSNRENIFVDKDIKVSVPKNQHEKQISEDEIAEDIDYEELK